MKSKSVYQKAFKNKRIAAYILLPLMEFEFAFNGSQKPALTQSESNLAQLRALYRICRRHCWISSEISKLGSKDEYWFKISNRGFKEIYRLAGPLSDSNKSRWAELLSERSEARAIKDRNINKKLLALLKDRELSTREICLSLRRLPYTMTRHLRSLREKGLIEKTQKGWKNTLLASQQTRPHEAGIPSKRTS